ncbi:class I SAM-dependent methyltransferase [Halobaculum magnesiiphilum]|uniref:Class I SAM-dependent methyltransferase n=1 Tax=Halobaculum magnesiiphilum TaxID=1017351 RepID=A0A8T8WD61_9EURY|nr:class I SAM-dependent methyltransferase [Halobaculum magnesiiphilum]QZP37789.1 class I SAM-dependent methyltransferase [Halobaculum magnesiiphilum]
MTPDNPTHTDDSDPTEGDGVDASDPSRSPPSAASTYDRIATHFSKTREHAWPEVESFLDGRSGRVGLDVGCGNGRHCEPLADRVDRVVGVDVSRGLLLEAGARASECGYDSGVSFVRGDAAALPVADSRVDLAVYVAALHHLRPRERRVASLSELARALAPDGRALVSAWSTAHDRFDADADSEAGFDTTVDWTLPGGETVPRFYHIYAPREFDADLAASDLRVVRSVVSSGNCYAVVAPE